MTPSGELQYSPFGCTYVKYPRDTVGHCTFEHGPMAVNSHHSSGLIDSFTRWLGRCLKLALDFLHDDWGRSGHAKHLERDGRRPSQTCRRSLLWRCCLKGI